jgi:hypothetical protein
LKNKNPTLKYQILHQLKLSTFGKQISNNKYKNY